MPLSRKELALKWHPDKAKSEDFGVYNQRMSEINNAVDTIAMKGWSIRRTEIPSSTHLSSRYSWESEAEFKHRQQKETAAGPHHMPPWETDHRGSHHIGKDRRDINYCKKEIYDYSKRYGAVSDMTLIAFDGAFFRLSFTAKTNPQSLDFAAQVMAEWNSSGSYSTEAVFVIDYSRETRIKLLWLHGRLVTENIYFSTDDPDVGWINSNKLLQQVREHVRTH